MKRAKYHKKEESIFELLSDISLSTLGLFLIFFVVYSLVFNSKASLKMTQERDIAKQEIERIKTDISDANRRANNAEQKVQSITQERDVAKQENEKLKTDISDANRRANDAEQKMQLMARQNQYTGYYKGNSTGKVYHGVCDGSNVSEVNQENTIIYIQLLNLAVYSTTSKYGTLTYSFRGNLEGNTFKSDSSEYSRTPSIESCGDHGERQILINFYDNHLDFYFISSDSNNIENSTAERLNKVN
ncbi:hypothetical protein [Microcoleus anatoxicus]|uniref:Uncharacterized protein n=1 Tax=Microcoleus anatoxicus PTRS2 TaxID=2705321 RepID=A0ABU8YSL5_9CYAN